MTQAIVCIVASCAEAIMGRQAAMTALHRATYAAEEKYRSTKQESTTHTKIITTTREHATIWK
jgi:hypothetical protein